MKEVFGGFYLIDVPDLDAADRVRRADPIGPPRRVGRGAPDRGALAGSSSARPIGGELAVFEQVFPEECGGGARSPGLS